MDRLVLSFTYCILKSKLYLVETLENMGIHESFGLYFFSHIKHVLHLKQVFAYMF